MQGGATLTMNTDGTGSFIGKVSSTDDDDTFKLRIAVFGSDNRVILEFPGPGSTPMWSKETILNTKCGKGFPTTQAFSLGSITVYFSLSVDTTRI